VLPLRRHRPPVEGLPHPAAAREEFADARAQAGEIMIKFE
jgi:hypothetical protein